MLHTPWVGGIYMFLLLSNTEISSFLSYGHFSYKKTSNILLIKTNIHESLTKFERSWECNVRLCINSVKVKQ